MYLEKVADIFSLTLNCWVGDVKNFQFLCYLMNTSEPSVKRQMSYDSWNTIKTSQEWDLNPRPHSIRGPEFSDLSLAPLTTRPS